MFHTYLYHFTRCRHFLFSFSMIIILGVILFSVIIFTIQSFISSFLGSDFCFIPTVLFRCFWSFPHLFIFPKNAKTKSVVWSRSEAHYILSLTRTVCLKCTRQGWLAPSDDGLWINFYFSDLFLKSFQIS
jgi:F0F1-type ATP synthase assembly protein I